MRGRGCSKGAQLGGADQDHSTRSTAGEADYRAFATEVKNLDFKQNPQTLSSRSKEEFPFLGIQLAVSRGQAAQGS